MSDLLQPGATYLPSRLSAQALSHFGVGRFDLLLEELRNSGGKYERVGVDRALAIALDLALLGEPAKLRLLDVGCSVGTISALLASVGHRVDGIDSDVVARVQEWQAPSLLTQMRQAASTDNCHFFNRDLREHLRTSTEVYDAALLLSVVHHWLAGYGYTGQTRFERAEVGDTLRQLCARVRKYLYLEVPIVDEYPEMPPDPEGEYLFPSWFVSAGLATSIELIASTIATNGKPRRLYRIHLS